MKFWQKAYVLTLALFFVTLCGSIAALGLISQNQSFESECGKLLVQQHATAQSFVTDAAAVQARRPAALAQLARNYAAQQQGGLKVQQGENVWADTLPAPDAELPDPPAQGQRVHTVRISEGRHYLYVAARLPGPPEEMTMICAYDMEPFFEQWAQTWRTLVLAGLAVLAFLAVALYLILRGLSRPMERLAAVAGRLAQGDYSARSEQQGKDEVGQLARALDEMADQVQKNIEKLEQSAQRKQQLVDNMAHELRTPLTAIGGYAEYVQRAELSEKERYEATSYIIDETRRLAAMSERLLQMAALRGERAVCAPVDVSLLLEAVFSTMRSKARERQINLRVDSSFTGTLQGEKVLLESLLINLTDNALKACTPGDIVELGAEHTENYIRLWVKDTGCGMDQETIQRLGDPFFRPDKARSREQGGAGLGISLCRAIAAAHGAHLRFESTPGEGTIASAFFTSSQSADENAVIPREHT